MPMNDTPSELMMPGWHDPPIAMLLAFLLNLAFVLRLIRIEEANLQAPQGAAYEAYCAIVPRLLPSFSKCRLPQDTQWYYMNDSRPVGNYRRNADGLFGEA